MVDNPGRVTRRSLPKVPAIAQSITIDQQGVSIPPNVDLRVSYRNIFDVAPPAGVGDIVIPSAQLQSYVRFVFAGLQ